MENRIIEKSTNIYTKVSAGVKNINDKVSTIFKKIKSRKIEVTINDVAAFAFCITLCMTAINLISWLALKIDNIYPIQQDIMFISSLFWALGTLVAAIVCGVLHSDN
jgi:hypothetical protein